MQAHLGHVGSHYTSMLNTCPMCRGRQVNKVLARLISGPCDLCGGRGQVDTDLVCECGRPAVREVNNKKLCTRKKCGEHS